MKEFDMQNVLTRELNKARAVFGLETMPLIGEIREKT